MQIEGVSNATLLSIISEIGPDDFQKSDISKHFASWLRLAPNNKKTGGKIISNKVPKGSNRLKIALRNAANAIGNLKTPTCQIFLEKYCTGGKDLGMETLISTLKSYVSQNAGIPLLTQNFSLDLVVMTYQVDILNPKADKLLQDLADLKLISISKVSSDPFLKVVKRLRKKAAAIKTPILEEITKEVESVRSKRYGNKNKA